MESYGLEFTAISPPWTTLTAYDLNKGTIKWQIGLGDDYRAAVKGAHGTGAAEFMKSSVIVTSAGLLFVTAADRKLHIYDSRQRQRAAPDRCSAPPPRVRLPCSSSTAPSTCCSPLRRSAPARVEKAAPPTRTSQALPA